MGEKLPKKDRVPFVGGQVQRFACVYLIEAKLPAIRETYVKVGICGDRRLKDHLEDVQSANPFPVKVTKLYWFPDLNVARRVAIEARKSLCAYQERGEWFMFADVKFPAMAVEAAAHKLNIPIITNHRFSEMSKGPKAQRAQEIRRFKKTYGFSET